MGVDEILLAIILIGGLVVGFFGINVYRYAVIIMSGAGGFMLGRIACSMFFDDVTGEGVLWASDSGAVDSFVLGFGVIVGCALGFFLYNVMGPIVAAIGGGFLCAKALQAVGGADTTNALVGAMLGVIIGATLGILAVKFNKFPMLLFTALCGARITAYCGAYFLSTSSLGAAIAKPFLGIFAESFPQDAVRMAIFLELFVVLSVLGIIVQCIIRED